MAADILHALLPDFPDMGDIVRKSYAGKFPTADLTPLVPVGGRYVLELYHGPTSAFKDVALSVLPRLIGAAAKAEGMTCLLYTSRRWLLPLLHGRGGGRAAPAGHRQRHQR